MKMKYILFTILVFSFFLGNAQKNLVPNSSFELHKANKSIRAIIPWICTSGKNFGTLDGKAWSYFYLQEQFMGEWEKSKRKYLQVKLKEPLVKGKYYRAEFQLGRYIGFTTHIVNHFGILISKDSVDISKNIDREPQIISKIYAKNIDSLYLISGYFYSKGDEQFLTIGVFGNDESIHPISIQDTIFDIEDKETKIWTKNLIDNVRLYQIPAPKKLVLGGISFETNESRLKISADSILNKVKAIYEKKDIVNIIINGYTDSKGDMKTNIILSKRRADAVKQGLIKNDVNVSIQTNGFGSESPVGSNLTEKGRSMNRRVEIIIFEKSR